MIRGHPVLSSVKVSQRKSGYRVLRARRNAKETRQEGRHTREGLVERVEARERPNILEEDPIEEYRPLPVFVSDQIGGWLFVVSLEYILIRATLREGRSRSDKWSSHGRYFVLLRLSFSLPLLRVFFLPFSFPPLFSFFLSASFSSTSPPGETIRLVESAQESVLASGPSSFATWSLNGWKSDEVHLGCRLSLPGFIV